MKLDLLRISAASVHDLKCTICVVCVVSPQTEAAANSSSAAVTAKKPKPTPIVFYTPSASPTDDSDIADTTANSNAAEAKRKIPKIVWDINKTAPIVGTSTTLEKEYLR